MRHPCRIELADIQVLQILLEIVHFIPSISFILLYLRETIVIRKCLELDPTGMLPIIILD